MSDRIYRLTQAGRDAWETRDAAVPADYRRLLWMNEWLDELEGLGLIEQVPAGQEAERDFIVKDDTQQLEGEVLREETARAAAALSRTGAYLALGYRVRAAQSAKPYTKNILADVVRRVLNQT